LRGVMQAGGQPGETMATGAAGGDDARLVARMAARDPQALRAAIEAYAPALHRIACRMTGDAHEAEDLVQEAMLRLWDNAPRLAARHRAGEASAAGLRLGGWLKRVVTNLAIDRLRAVRRLSGEDVPDEEDDSPLADARIEAAQQVGGARALIAALPERQRAAIVLTYYEELPNAEAAEILDMNIKAFESLLFRARAALRKAFEAQGATP